MVRQILLIVFGAVVLIFLVLREAIDMAASIEYAEGAFPGLFRWIENRKWHRVLLLCTMLFYGGTLYEMLSQPPLPPIVNPDPAAKVIAPLVQENDDLKRRLAVFTEPEPVNSLRRQTARIADSLNAFWMNNPVPPQGPNQKESSDAYWVRVQAIYERAYRDSIIGIIRQYQDKGVPTGWLERSAENHAFGATPFNQLGSPVCFQDELCQFRELAYHVDSHDQKIGPDF